MNEYSYHSPDPYCYPGTNTLINKLGITDLDAFFIAEREFTAVRLTELQRKPVRGNFGFAHLKAIHRAIFGDIFDFAGKIRTGEFLVKDDTIFCLGRNIEEYSTAIFGKLKNENKLRGLKKDIYIDRLAYFMGEVNALHPFREGNGRASREFFRTLSLSAGYNLDWGAVSKDRLLEADINAFDRDYSLLKEILFEITTPI
jgi:cell filamentation protein